MASDQEPNTPDNPPLAIGRYGEWDTGLAKREEAGMAARDDRTRTGGISVGGILVIIGIVVAILWSFWLGLIIALIGLIAFGGFARGKWY